MDITGFRDKLRGKVSKYKYIAIVLVVGIVLMLLPGKSSTKKENTKTEEINDISLEQSLSQTLCKVQGAGKVEVVLNIDEGAKTIYQVDEDFSQSDTNHTDRRQTVIVTDSQRNQYGLVQQINPPVYLGAIILCEGADNPVVKLSLVEAVSKITGLNANQICVLKME